MSHLRDCILGKGQIFHQDIQAFVLFIQELPDPPGGQTPEKHQSLPGFPGIPRKLLTLQHSFREIKKVFTKWFKGFKEGFRCLSKCAKMRIFAAL